MISDIQLIDISYPIDSDIAIYPGNPAFRMNEVMNRKSGDSANVSEIVIGTHTGTHIDAPSHFIEGGMTVDEIPLERLSGKAKVFDAMGRTVIGDDFLSRCDIGADDILLFKTDTSKSWNCDSIMEEYTTLTYKAADYLVDRRVKLVGIDYLTIERPRGKREDGKSVHMILLENNILICEALNLRDVLPGEYSFYCFPLILRGADGCPVRAVLYQERCF